MTFKVVMKLDPSDAMNTLAKPKCNLCMQERLAIVKNICDKRVTVMNRNSEIYGACRHKTNFHIFCLRTDDPVINGLRNWAVKGLFKYYDLKPSTVVFEY